MILGRDGLSLTASKKVRWKTTTLKISKSVFCVYGFRMILTETAIISLNSINQLIFVMVKCGVLFAVRAKLLNIIQTNFSFKGLIQMSYGNNRRNRLST
jgi:hypothetical protein